MSRPTKIVIGAVILMLLLTLAIISAVASSRDMLVVTVTKADVSGGRIDLELDTLQYRPGGTILETVNVASGEHLGGSHSSLGGSGIGALITAFVPERGHASTGRDIHPSTHVNLKVKVGDVIRLNPGDELVFFTTTGTRETSRGLVIETLETRLRVSGP